MPHPPRRKTEWKDEYTLLCERCGYIIEDLDHTLPCPECGKPIGESLPPHQRTGSPWQQHPSFVSMLKTWFRVLYRPKQFFEDLNVNLFDARALMWRANLLAALMPTFIVGIMIVITIFDGTFHINNIFAVVLYLVLSLIYWGIAIAYTALAVPRVRYIARSREYRITNPAIWSAAGHASMGLTLAPLMISIAFCVGFGAYFFDLATPRFSVYLDMLIQFLYIASLPIAVIAFEVLLLIGTRRLRYRNTQAIPTKTEQPDA